MKVMDGFYFGLGVSGAIGMLSLANALVCGVFGLNQTDDSDGPEARSGLCVHVDHKTGVEYLSDGNGGLVVRVQKP